MDSINFKGANSHIFTSMFTSGKPKVMSAVDNQTFKFCQELESATKAIANKAPSHDVVDLQVYKATFNNEERNVITAMYRYLCDKTPKLNESGALSFILNKDGKVISKNTPEKIIETIKSDYNSIIEKALK